MNSLSVTALISQSINRNKDDDNVFELINVNNRIKLIEGGIAKFVIIIIVNGSIIQPCDINIFIENNEANRKLKLENIEITNESLNKYLNSRYIYEIEVNFPGEGEYHILASVKNNIIQEYYLGNFILE